MIGHGVQFTLKKRWSQKPPPFPYAKKCFAQETEVSQQTPTEKTLFDQQKVILNPWTKQKAPKRSVHTVPRQSP